MAPPKFKLGVVTFFPFNTLARDKNLKKVMFHGYSKDGMYPITSPPITQSSTKVFLARKQAQTVWHNRPGHPIARVVNSVLNKLHLPHFSSASCTHYDVAKSHKTQLPVSITLTKFPFELRHADVWCILNYLFTKFIKR